MVAFSRTKTACLQEAHDIICNLLRPHDVCVRFPDCYKVRHAGQLGARHGHSAIARAWNKEATDRVEGVNPCDDAEIEPGRRQAIGKTVLFCSQLRRYGAEYYSKQA